MHGPSGIRYPSVQSQEKPPGINGADEDTMGPAPFSGDGQALGFDRAFGCVHIFL